MSNLKMLALVGLSVAPVGILVSALIALSPVSDVPQSQADTVAESKTTEPQKPKRGDGRRYFAG